MQYKSVKGMEDILPDGVRIWQEVERLARLELESAGYREIRTPVLEESPLFVRSIGEATDIVSKEMFTFEDRKGRPLTMRPEGTAPIVRAYIEHSLNSVYSEAEGLLYYIGPMFRAERPQKGRSRQFHQIGVERIGSRSPQVDAEVIIRLDRLLKRLGLDNFKIKLNSLGCKTDKENFSGKLKEYLDGNKSGLCDDCKDRIEKNVLRVLDCKSETCKAVLKNAPDMSGSLCGKCADHFAAVRAMLQVAGVEFEIAKNLVRGLDYYTGPVFEVTHQALGSQDAIGAGGRYDNLVKELGGPDVGAVGFAIGIERVIMALGDKKDILKPKIIYFAVLGNTARDRCLKLSEEVSKSINDDPCKLKAVVLVGLEGSSLKSQMRNADKQGAKFMIIMGEDEIARGEVAIRDMETKQQENKKFSEIIEHLKNNLG